MTGAQGQLALALGPFQNRKLFAQHFLEERLRELPEFAAAPVDDLLHDLAAIWDRERPGLVHANEAQTESRLIRPVLDRLGFEYSVQSSVGVAGRRRAPDYALFGDPGSRSAAARRTGADAYRDAVAIVEAKSFDRPLDIRRAGGALSEDPVAQIIHYVSITRCRWGILTNGRLWRLYAAEGDLVEGASYEIDLVALLEARDPVAFRYFAAFFARDAFVPDPAGRSFLDRALAESAANAVEVGQALQAQVYAAVPLVAEGLVGEGQRDDQALDEAFDHSLVFLYRILFCLHAEARGLLPIENPHYRRYSLTWIKERVAKDLDAGRVFSARSDDLYNDLRALFRIVDRGDDALGVSEYNGGLFRAARYPYFEGRFVADHLLAPALDQLARVARESVDYRSLSVRHLGTIYEGLLAYRLADEPATGVLRLSGAETRHSQGAYFTPEAVVDRIVERTLEPLLDDRSREVAAEALRGEAALDAFLELRVCDPAMGSGHFLVSAAAWMAQYIATDPSYDGDLSLVEIQRLVAERSIYGVDLSPLAVELAQLALWLTTVRRDEPLAFLNNLRVGNSLVGARVEELLDAHDGTLFASSLARDAEVLLARAGEIRRMPSRSGADVHAKEQLADTAAALRAPLERYASTTMDQQLLGKVGPALHWELEFPEVFLGPDGRPRADGGFDAILGNPPYVRIQALGRELAGYCRERFDAASGSFDVYVPFVEQGLALLSPRGRLGYIMPSKFTKLDYGRGLRERFAREELVEEIIDFGDAQLFPGVTNYTAIVLLTRAGRGTELTYRRVRGDADEVRRTLVDLDSVLAERYSAGTLGAEPWVLATGEEAALLAHLREGAPRLDEVTTHIFQGLITGADSVFVLEDRGARGSMRRLWSPESQREIELEPDLLHPLASGSDVDAYALLPLGDVVLFPYSRRADNRMQLVSPAELAERPSTLVYLREHEKRLRARDGGKMNTDRWYAFARTQNLGLHDLPKLGVAATVQNLEVSIDPDGAAYFHNVRVNGIIGAEQGPSLWALLVLLNSTALDWVFRRGAAPHANGYFAANKQFIAGLPVRSPDAAGARLIDAIGRRLHATAARIGHERRGFLDWLSDVTGQPARRLPGATVLSSFEQRTTAELIAVLARSRAQLSVDPHAKAFRDRLDAERENASVVLTELASELKRERQAGEEAVADLYELSAAQRALVART